MHASHWHNWNCSEKAASTNQNQSLQCICFFFSLLHIEFLSYVFSQPPEKQKHCLHGFPANAIGLFLFALFRARWQPYSHWRAPALMNWIQWSHLWSAILTIYERSNVPIIAYNLQLHSQYQGRVHVVINGNRVCLCLTFKSSWSSHSRDHLYATT